MTYKSLEIPVNPRSTYFDQGWVSYEGWFGDNYSENINTKFGKRQLK